MSFKVFRCYVNIRGSILKRRGRFYFRERSLQFRVSELACGTVTGVVARSLMFLA